MTQPANNKGKWTIETVQYGKQKLLKIVLIYAGYFSDKWSPYEPEKFYPRPSLQTVPRNKYWQNRYRVKINGKWWMEKAKYQTFTKEEVFRKFVLKAGKFNE